MIKQQLTAYLLVKLSHLNQKQYYLFYLYFQILLMLYKYKYQYNCNKYFIKQYFHISVSYFCGCSIKYTMLKVKMKNYCNQNLKNIQKKTIIQNNSDQQKINNIEHFNPFFCDNIFNIILSPGKVNYLLIENNFQVFLSSMDFDFSKSFRSKNVQCFILK